LASNTTRKTTLMIGRLAPIFVLAVLVAYCFLILTPTPTRAGDMGRVEGRVVVSPATPPVQRFGEPNERPFKGQLAVINEHQVVVANINTTGDGAFAIDLPPGHYSLRPNPVSPIGRIMNNEVIVSAGQITKARIIYDIGIR
jgi:hypothetical protein